MIFNKLSIIEKFFKKISKQNNFSYHILMEIFL
nr:MAG TPA: hypothetical protein [Caudoviricetes sp.]